MYDDHRQEREHLEWAWTIIANVSGGDWKKQSNEWQEVAAKWRDQYHEEHSLKEEKTMVKYIKSSSECTKGVSGQTSPYNGPNTAPRDKTKVEILMDTISIKLDELANDTQCIESKLSNVMKPNCYITDNNDPEKSIPESKLVVDLSHFVNRLCELHQKNLNLLDRIEV